MADEDGGGPLHPDVAAERNQTLRLTGQVLAITGALLPTPEAKLSESGPDYARANRERSGGDDLTTTIHKQFLLPTPVTTDARGGRRHTTTTPGAHNGTSLTDALLPTPTTAAASGGNARRGGDRSDELLLPGIAERAVEELLPTPNASAMNYDEDPDQFAARRARRGIKDGNNGGGLPLGIAAQTLAADGFQWGEYEPAIRHTEQVTGRPVPPPAVPDGRNGRMRLSPVFEEWMMLLPAGYVTDPDIGLTRDEQVKAIGNMVCPPQAAHAIRAILTSLGDTVIWPDVAVDLTGITHEPTRGTWRAKAKRNGRLHHIGRFPTPEQAVAARSAWLEARS